MRYLAVLSLIAVLGGSCSAGNDIRTESIEYEQGGETLQGMLAYDASIKGKRPGVLVIHEWLGLTDYSRERARQLAAMGYAAFALDMYGKGVLASSPEEAGRLAGRFFADRQLMRDRAAAGLDVLRSREVTDAERLAVIGFCFGGTTALELAMSGADLKAVVSFHGVLTFPDLDGLKDIDGQVLVLTGGMDPHVPPDDVLAFWKALEADSVKYQINIYGGAVHSFTNPASGSDKSTGVAYDETGARRAWREMQDLFKEVF
jgi:dienelactone hydrolase